MDYVGLWSKQSSDSRADKRKAAILVKTTVLRAPYDGPLKLPWQMLTDLVHVAYQLWETCYKLLVQTATLVQAVAGHNWADFKLPSSYIKVLVLYQEMTGKLTVSCQSQLRLQLRVRFSQASKRILRLVHIC